MTRAVQHRSQLLAEDLIWIILLHCILDALQHLPSSLPLRRKSIRSIIRILPLLQEIEAFLPVRRKFGEQIFQTKRHLAFLFEGLDENFVGFEEVLLDLDGVFEGIIRWCRKRGTSQ